MGLRYDDLLFLVPPSSTEERDFEASRLRRTGSLSDERVATSGSGVFAVPVDT